MEATEREIGRDPVERRHELVDRNTGRALAISLWESEAAMKASEDATAQLAAEVTQQTGVTADVIGRYEVALVL